MKRRAAKRFWSLTRRAERDLYEIGDYTHAMWGEEQRYRYLATMRQTFDALCFAPLSGMDFDYVRENYRRKTVGEHYVFYKVIDDHHIKIITVLHQKRDVIRHLVDDEDHES